MAREKTTGFFFKCTPEEMALLEQRMAETNITNKSAFIRKMCIDGHVFNLELSTVNEIKRLLGINSNNLNQLTKRVNSGGEARRDDVAELNGQHTEILHQFGKALNLLSAIAEAKPGKWFVPPPTIRDLPEYNEKQIETEGK